MSPKWKETKSYPYSKILHSSASVFFNDEFYVFAGETAENITDRIVRFTPSTEVWTDIARLKSPRSAHSVIHVQQKVYVFGGIYNLEGEVCDSLLSCEYISNSQLNAKYPKLFDFNQKQCTLIDPHVLILATRKSIYDKAIYNKAKSNENVFQKITMMASLFGNTTTEINFSVENLRTAILDGTCGLTFKGKYYIFGGIDFTGPLHTFKHSKQIRRLDDCKFTKIGELDFEFSHGACTVGRDQIYLAFGGNTSTNPFISKTQKMKNSTKHCYRASEPTAVFNKTESSLYEHSNINIASSDTNLLSCGHGIYETKLERKLVTTHEKCEFLNLNTTSWKTVSDYDYPIFEAPVIFYRGQFLKPGFIIFGGSSKDPDNFESSRRHADSFHISWLDEANPTKWKQLGRITFARHAHKVVQFGNEFLVIGGATTKQTAQNKIRTNRCKFAKRKGTKFGIDCEDKEPVLISTQRNFNKKTIDNKDYKNPLLIEVDKDFCIKK